MTPSAGLGRRHNLMPGSESAVVIGVDIGGTFTDLCLLGADGRVVTAKLPSTPGDYSEGVAQALAAAFAAAPDAARQQHELVHGSTIATNAVLELRGAKTALLTTAGFRDVLELRRLRMPQLYNLQWEKPAPLVPRSLRLEVHERLDARGEVIVPLDEEGVRRHADLLREQGVESVAVCLLHAYANPEHEQRVGALLRELLPGVPVSLSTEIIREAGEFERTSTAVINAYVQPVVGRYLTAIEERLTSSGGDSRLLVMQSNGAVMPAGAARQRPCYLIESGPAAGVIAAQAVARAIDCHNLVTLDMGGTTAKAALIEDGEMTFVDEYEIGAGLTIGSRLMKGDGYLLRIPAIDLAEVGAGGGSLAYVDAGGALQVGPRSVGADPGPACYGRGNSEATITDANVVLGYIGPERFAGGALQLDPALAQRALERLGRQLGMDAAAAAYAVHVVGNTRMSRAIRAVSTERGHDARDFTLLAFGGSGPLHAAQLARSLGIRRVVVPPLPGVFSALGLLCAPAGYQFVHTFRARLDRLSDAGLAAAVDDLTAQARLELRRLGYPADAVEFGYEADLRYVGQQFRVRVTLPDLAAIHPDGAVAAVRQRFEDEHERRYHHRAPQAPVELVGFHLAARVRAPAPLLDLAGVAADMSGPAAPSAATRPAYFSREEGFVAARLLRRQDLHTPVTGPALVEEPDTTIVIPPGWNARLDEQGNVVMTVEE
ncbi:MAG: hypothetical protein DCC58_04510 [Chloroflexi bacterium]|nr:MAG: hypothetical protein DCC58_04510 [Chloroflexota bacterium]